MTDPLAYFLTWHTYGTWLQGERPGSDDRRHREYGREFVRANATRRLAHASRMAADTVTLDESMRVVIQDAIVEVCEHRNWDLQALHLRTTHVHAVVAAENAPERVLNDFKSYATRALRQRKVIDSSRRVWARHGSPRYLWNADEVTAAIDYTVNRQGAALIPKPAFSRRS
ncbi:MAG: transposase [Planctomycetaceae bacterium]